MAVEIVFSSETSRDMGPETAVFTSYYELYFLFMKLTHIPVCIKRMHDIFLFFLFTSRYTVFTFDVLYVQIFI